MLCCPVKKDRINPTHTPIAPLAQQTTRAHARYLPSPQTPSPDVQLEDVVIVTFRDKSHFWDSTTVCIVGSDAYDVDRTRLPGLTYLAGIN